MLKFVFLSFIMFGLNSFAVSPTDIKVLSLLSAEEVYQGIEAPEKVQLDTQNSDTYVLVKTVGLLTCTKRSTPKNLFQNAFVQYECNF